MAMRIIILLLAISVIASQALAQDSSHLPAQALPQNGGAGLRTGNITSSGETVPNPGASQSAGTTDMDRGIQREDQKIESSICKGC